MPEADVLYSDVKFTRDRGNANVTASSTAETTYSEVRIKNQPSAELPASQQQLVSNGRSKVTSERVALAVLSVLLAAALITLGITSYINIQTMKQLTDERDAAIKNLTEKHCEKPCNTVPLPCTGTPGEENGVCPKCEEGWEQHGGNCYYFSSDGSTWEESRAACIQQGAALVKIDSREEQNFLEKKLRVKMNFPEDKFWIGLTDSQEEKKWLWSDSSPLNESLTFWSAGEPDNWDGKDPDGEDCVRMGERGGAEDLKCWFDKSCKVPHRSICERKSTKTGHIKCV